MSVVNLQCALRIVVGGRKLRNWRWPTEVQSCPEKTAIDAVVLEVFVNPNEVLIAIAEVTGVENTRINDRQGTWTRMAY